VTNLQDELKKCEQQRQEEGRRLVEQVDKQARQISFLHNAVDEARKQRAAEGEELQMALQLTELRAELADLQTRLAKETSEKHTLAVDKQTLEVSVSFSSSVHRFN
jgi:hypothetical protein